MQCHVDGNQRAWATCDLSGWKRYPPFEQPGPALSPGQTIATCQTNISQHCWAQHAAYVWPQCCDVLRHVGCCWLKFENGHIWGNSTQHVVTHRNTVAKRTQHVAPSNVAICWVGKLRSFGFTYYLVRPRMEKKLALDAECRCREVKSSAGATAVVMANWET